MGMGKRQSLFGRKNKERKREESQRRKMENGEVERVKMSGEGVSV